ncbi:MAG TPA: alpha/beta hydrolase [Anaeromyxobacteraceae bacterium]|nr:alpha/beta hydrolase [Anaeromyxobacteraceae bacterium]
MATIDIQGPAGRLEGLLEPVERPRFAALVCHPHPQQGGTMHTHATYRLARAARASGGVSLRFNYRGVGRSAGSYGRLAGESEDALAALDLLAARFPALPRLASGFSFGAFAALSAGLRDAGVRGFLLAGLVVRPYDELPRDLEPLRRSPLPCAVVQARFDQLGSPDEVQGALLGSAGPRRVAAVEGATHLFTEELDALEREAEGAFGWLLEAAGIPAGGA